MLDALRSERYLHLLDRLEDASHATGVVAPETSLDALAGVEFRKLRKAMAALGEEPTDAELHAIRIRGKRARYAAELAETTAGKSVSRFIRKARAFQDALGEHQDAVVAEERLRRLIAESGGRQAAFAAGRMVERQHARRDAARAALPEIWKRVEKRGLAAWP